LGIAGTKDQIGNDLIDHRKGDKALKREAQERWELKKASKDVRAKRS
jgi:hypothetical protein